MRMDLKISVKGFVGWKEMRKIPVKKALLYLKKYLRKRPFIRLYFDKVTCKYMFEKLCLEENPKKYL